MKELLQHILHTSVDIKQKNGKYGLPLYLTSGCNFYDVSLFGILLTVVKLSGTEHMDIRKLRHNLSRYEEVFRSRICFFIPDLTRTKRDAIIKAGISFIAPPGQVYLPFLGVALNDKYPTRKFESRDKMTPVEQLLFFYLLYHNQEYIKAELADSLHVTRAAITKVTKSLNERGLIKELRKGKEVVVSLMDTPVKSFQSALPHLINPVKKTVCYQKCFSSSELLKAGETALSAISMLNSPQIEVRACYVNDDRLKKMVTISDERWVENDELLKLEIWTYDPRVLSGNEQVDLLSLKMSLSDEFDERVQGELEEVLEEKGWQ